MKIKFLLLLSVFFLMTLSSSAQDYKSSVNINAQFSNYLNEYYSPVNPGIEILYENKIVSLFSISAGINYSFTSWQKSVGVKSNFRRRYHEIFVPVIFKGRISDGFNAAFGIYPGWLFNGKELYKGSSTGNWNDNTHNTNFEESPKFAMDLFFGLELFDFVMPNKKKHSIKFTPFLKYRLNENWLDERRENQNSFGLKINYLTGLK
ncbi:MAG: hypothetical protein ACQETJ_08030 [Bacteroidota bacterium]